MNRFLSARDKIFLTISMAADFLGGADFQPVSSSYLYNLYTGPTGESKASFNQAIFRGLKAKQLEKVGKGEETTLKLTPIGRKLLFHDFPQLLHRGEVWDRLWRIITFDIGEADRATRDNLRERLKKLGFGALQESFYLSPFELPEDLFDFLDTEGLLDRVHIFEAKALGGGDERLMAEKVWGLSEMNRHYKKVLVSQKIEADSVTTANMYLTVLASDPLLPKELLPLDWSADKVRKLLKA